MMEYRISQHLALGEGWVPKRRMGDVSQALLRADEKTKTTFPSAIESIPTKEVRPTYFITNKFNIGAQNIVESYGVARYKEINPAVFTIITLPFLFAVMFGDVGHGSMMTMFGLSMVLFEKQLGKSELNEVFLLLFFFFFFPLLRAL